MKTIVLVVVLSCLLSIMVLPAIAYDWVSNPSNGHWYKPVSAIGISWTSAETIAEENGGYLACSNSQEENNFIYNLISNKPEFWIYYGNTFGPWIGGYQIPGSEEPAGGWEWIDGTKMIYTNWGNYEPNDSPANENRIMLFGFYGSTGSWWNDFQMSGQAAGKEVTGYIIESNFNPSQPSVPEPSSLLALCSGMMGLFTLRYRKKHQ